MTPAVVRKNAHGGPQVRRNTRLSLRSGFNGLCRVLPGAEFLWPPSPTDWRSIEGPVGPDNLHQLDTSNGCQDHTVLPYASAPFISRAVFAHGKPALQTRHAPDAAASTATRPNVCDDGQRASSRDGMAGVLVLIWGSGEAEYFLLGSGKRLPVGQINL